MAAISELKKPASSASVGSEYSRNPRAAPERAVAAAISAVTVSRTELSSPRYKADFDGKWYSNPPLDTPASAATASRVTEALPVRARMSRRAPNIRWRVSGATDRLYRLDG